MQPLHHRRRAKADQIRIAVLLSRNRKSGFQCFPFSFSCCTIGRMIASSADQMLLLPAACPAFFQNGTLPCAWYRQDTVPFRGCGFQRGASLVWVGGQVPSLIKCLSPWDSGGSLCWHMYATPVRLEGPFAIVVMDNQWQHLWHLCQEICNAAL